MCVKEQKCRSGRKATMKSDEEDSTYIAYCLWPLARGWSLSYKLYKVCMHCSCISLWDVSAMVALEFTCMTTRLSNRPVLGGPLTVKPIKYDGARTMQTLSCMNGLRVCRRLAFVSRRLRLLRLEVCGGPPNCREIVGFVVLDTGSFENSKSQSCPVHVQQLPAIALLAFSLCFLSPGSPSYWRAPGWVSLTVCK